jgi:tetratricopeptide (TPR) repeat protein
MEVKARVADAGPAARQLEGLAAKGRDHTPENQALSMYYLFCGLVDDDPILAADLYHAALEWNATNQNAEQLLRQAAVQAIMDGLGRARRTRAGASGSAHDILEGLRAGIKRWNVNGELGADAQVTRARALLTSHTAQHLLMDGRIREAVPFAEEAVGLDPNDRQLRELLDEVRGEVGEEQNIGPVRKAQEAMGRDDYDTAIQQAEKVAPSSRYAGEARHLRSVALFQRARQAAKNKRPDDAVRDLKAALELNQNPEERAVLTSTLRDILLGISGNNRLGGRRPTGGPRPL